MDHIQNHAQDKYLIRSSWPKYDPPSTMACQTTPVNQVWGFKLNIMTFDPLSTKVRLLCTVESLTLFMKGKRQVVFCGNQRKMTDKHMLARQRGASTRTILTWKSHRIMIIFGLFKCDELASRTSKDLNFVFLPSFAHWDEMLTIRSIMNFQRLPKNFHRVAAFWNNKIFISYNWPITLSDTPVLLATLQWQEFVATECLQSLNHFDSVLRPLLYGQFLTVRLEWPHLNSWE